MGRLEHDKLDQDEAEFLWNQSHRVYRAVRRALYGAGPEDILRAFREAGDPAITSHAVTDSSNISARGGLETTQA